MRRPLLTIASTIVDNLDTLLVDSTFHPRVVVCIPAYNEETRIGHVIREASLFANQILVCDDGSSDGTALEAEANGGRVIRHFRNLGKGAALRTLLREAEKASPDIIVTIDGDGQHSPRDIPKLLSPIVERDVSINYERDTSTFNPVSHMFRVIWGLFLAFVKEHFNEFAQRESEALPQKNSPPSRLDKVGNGGFPEAENRGLTPRLNSPLQSPLTPRHTDNHHGG